MHTIHRKGNTGFLGCFDVKIFMKLQLAKYFEIL